MRVVLFSFCLFIFVIKLAQYIAINHAIMVKIQFSPLTPMSDQDRISPYNINTISTRYVMRIKENINLRIIS